ncbi:MAG TPA: TonB-dependent receptor [Pseudomonadales bacterium]
MATKHSPGTRNMTGKSAGAMAATFTLSLLGSAIAMAQQAAPAVGADVEEIAVTGSRLRNDSFTAPTPVMTLSTEQLKAVAPVNIAESLQQLPQFSTGGQSSTAVSYANLRNIGSERTLVLLDGRRHVPTFSSGVVDLTTIPTALIQRTEMVTGGASASWGSDAVSGVLNLILNEELEGFQGNVQYGESEYGDDESYNTSLAWGTAFAGGSGHIIAGVEKAESKGIPTYLYPDVSRPDVASRGNVSNSNFTTGLPQFIYAQDVRRADVHDGGLITSGPLRGTTFLPGGQTGTFGYGQVFGNLMIGGTDNPFEAPDPGGDISPPFERTAFLTRINYDFSDALSGFVEYNYSESLSNGRAILPRNQGATTANAGCTRTGYSGSAIANINVSIDNAFLPQSVRDRMVAANVNCFNFGRSFREEGLGLFRTSEGSPEIHRYVAGLEGDIGNGWTWDTYVQYGDSSFQQRRGGNIHVTRFQNAVDAVFDANGQIACRVNIDAVATNNDPNCAPFNLFGAGSPSAAAMAYVTGTSSLDMDIEQTVAAFNVGGDLFEGWAGPISSAFGVEYREESLSAVADPDSELNLWSTSNRKGIDGSYDVREFYAEVGVPLVNGRALMESVDLQLAARATDYSTSGNVTTWKAGLNWDVNDQVRMRFTKSRDIRAGNIGELFTPTAVALININHPTTSVRGVAQVTTTGNTALDPEEADTLTAGIIFTPNFLDGLQLSADYYDIQIDGQIGSVNGQQIADQCFLFNEQDFCSRITTVNGSITAINNSFLNLDQFETSGVDLVAAYRMDVGPGDMSLRLSSSYVDKRETTFQIAGTAQDTAGQLGSPHWKHFVQVGYTIGRFNGLIDWRWYQHSKISNQRIEGFAGLQGANINEVPNLHYTALSLNYDIDGMLGDWNGTVFARIDNLFDKEPPFPLRSAYNDNNGRGYRLGMRFDF